MNKFILAVRLFQRGKAVLEIVKRDYPIREMLEGAASYGRGETGHLSSTSDASPALTRSIEFAKFEHLTKAS